MEFSFLNASLAVGAGLASVLSPCVLPVVPVIAAGVDKSDRLRPLLLVLGLSLTFMTMGAVSSLFGAMLVGKTRLIEQTAGVVVIIMGVLIVFDVNLFKRLYKLSNINVEGKGRFGGLVIGMALGVIWVPCVGPVLSSILALVATSGKLAEGVLMLAFYSLGFAVPMLIVAYTSHLMQGKFRTIAARPGLVRYVTGAVLIAFGVYTVGFGNVAF